MAAANDMADELQISSRCLLRFVTALALEAAGIDHGCQSAVSELNTLTGRQHTAREWLAVLEPVYNRRFSPTGAAAPGPAAADVPGTVVGPEQPPAQR